MRNARTIGREMFSVDSNCRLVITGNVQQRPSTVSPASKRRRRPIPTPPPRSSTSMSNRRNRSRISPFQDRHLESPSSSFSSRPSTTSGRSRSRSTSKKNTRYYKDYRLNTHQLQFHSTPTGNHFPSSPFLRVTKSGHPATYRSLSRESRNNLERTTSPSKSPSKSSPQQSQQQLPQTVPIEKHLDLLESIDVNEHRLSSLWNKACQENKIRFINYILDEICGVDNEKDDASNSSTNDSGSETQNIYQIDPESIIDADDTFANCNVDLLECLIGSSGYNVFRRRTLMWHIMKMSNRRGEGGVWENVVLNNRSLRMKVERMEQNIETLKETIDLNNLQYTTNRNKDILEKDIVVGRLKTKVEKIEEKWYIECERALKLDKEVAIKSSIMAEQVNKIQELNKLKQDADTLLRYKDTQMKKMRIKIHELQQMNKNYTGVSPSLNMIMKAMKEEKKVVVEEVERGLVDDN